MQLNYSLLSWWYIGFKLYFWNCRLRKNSIYFSWHGTFILSNLTPSKLKHWPPVPMRQWAWNNDLMSPISLLLYLPFFSPLLFCYFIPPTPPPHFIHPSLPQSVCVWSGDTVKPSFTHGATQRDAPACLSTVSATMSDQLGQGRLCFYTSSKKLQWTVSTDIKRQYLTTSTCDNC